MAPTGRPIPDWINKWLILSSLICIYDGSFCVLRPHSLPGGCLEKVFWGYKIYIMADKHYADASDSFIWAQGLGNILESAINLVVVFKVLKSIQLSKLVCIAVSVMTAWKTTLFCLYSLDIGHGGHTVERWRDELLVHGLGLIWLVVPVYVVWVLTKDFVNDVHADFGAAEHADFEDEVDAANESMLLNSAVHNKSKEPVQRRYNLRTKK